MLLSSTKAVTMETEPQRSSVVGKFIEVEVEVEVERLDLDLDEDEEEERLAHDGDGSGRLAQQRWMRGGCLSRYLYLLP